MIGFMQGRLSPLIDGKIQAFPTDAWRDEFKLASAIGLGAMEWTLDHDGLHKNPLLTKGGRDEIRRLCKSYSVTIPSLTGDCFMQSPFWKTEDVQTKNELIADFEAIVSSCSKLGIRYIVVPLVDGGSLQNKAEEDELVGFLRQRVDYFSSMNVCVVFESDYEPKHLAKLMHRLEENCFGVNYDMGNSAALGFKVDEEFALYGDRILNVHVKDRKLGATTVPLGDGNVDFVAVFRALSYIKYEKNLILQTARAQNDNHSDVLAHYHTLVKSWMEQAQINNG